MTINNHQDNIEQKAHFYFVLGHGWLDVPERNIKTSEYLLEPLTLAKEYNISPQAQALFSLHPDISILKSIEHSMPASFYYVFNVDIPSDKFKLIKHILKFSTNNQEATDYAYKLYQEFPQNIQAHLFPEVMETGIAKTNKKFENIYKTLEPENIYQKTAIFEAIIMYNQNNTQALNDAYNFYTGLTPNKQINFLQTILKSGIQKTNKQFENIYKTVRPTTEDEKVSLITSIIFYDTTNQEAVDYAYSLYQSLYKIYQIHVLAKIFESGIQKTNKTFENIYKSLKLETTGEKLDIIRIIYSYGKTDRDAIDYAYNLYESLEKKYKEQVYRKMNDSTVDIIRTIISSDKAREEDINYAFSLFKQLDVGYQFRFFEDIMTSGVWKTNKHFSDLFANNVYYAITAAINTEKFNIETIKALYEKVEDNDKKKRFLTLALDAVNSAIYSGITHVRNNKEITVSDKELINITKELLSLGCDIKAASIRKHSNNFTPLFIAIAIGKAPLLELLIEHGANINEPITSKVFDEIGNHIQISTLTPLQYAVEQDAPLIIEALLKYGADINAKSPSDPNNNITPLIIAALNQKKEITKLLLEKGADPNLSGAIDGKIITPLLATVREVKSGRNHIITELIKHNVDLNAKDSDGNSALDIAIEQKIKHQWNVNNSYETVDILQKAGAKAYKKHEKKSAATKE